MAVHFDDMEAFFTRHFKLIRILHFVIWCVWAILVLTYNGEYTKNCYTQLFGRYVNYNTFKWSELVFMFGGGLVLLALLIQVIKYSAYIIFELIFLLIIFVHIKVYFYCP